LKNLFFYYTDETKKIAAPANNLFEKKTITNIPYVAFFLRGNVDFFVAERCSGFAEAVSLLLSAGWFLLLRSDQAKQRIVFSSSSRVPVARSVIALRSKAGFGYLRTLTQLACSFQSLKILHGYLPASLALHGFAISLV
jgi:hypothetical protein